MKTIRAKRESHSAPRQIEANGIHWTVRWFAVIRGIRGRSWVCPGAASSADALTKVLQGITNFASRFAEGLLEAPFGSFACAFLFHAPIAHCASNLLFHSTFCFVELSSNLGFVRHSHEGPFPANRSGHIQPAWIRSTTSAWNRRRPRSSGEPAHANSTGWIWCFQNTHLRERW